MPQYQGVWSLQQQMQALTSGQWATDPLFDYTTLLLQADNAANSAQNNTFLDSSTNAFAITRNGNTTQGTFSPFSLQPGEWSNYFPGSASISFSTSSGFNIDTYDCFECWVNFSSLGTSNLIAGREANFWIAYNHASIGGASNKFVFAIYNGSSWQAVSSNTTPMVGAWYHIAGIRDSGTLRLYINGVQENTATFSGSPSNNPAYNFFVGALNAGESMTGYVSNVRLVTGSTAAVLPYTANFTPSPRPLTAVTGTQILTCQGSRFFDANTQTTAKTLGTITGTPSVQAFSPFAPQYQYTPSGTGGSGYFDGTGDYLSTSGSALVASGDFTIEAWAYSTGQPNFMGIISTRVGSSGYAITYNNSGSLQWSIIGSDFVLSPMPVNQWFHVAMVRSGTGSNNVSAYLNGVRVGQTTNTSNTSTSSLVVGRYYPDVDNYYWQGYISGARVVIGSALYSGASFTLPTAPPTAVTNTQFLANFTNAGILDGTMKNNLETVGNAQVSTSVVKYGSGSIAVTGNSGNYLISPNVTNYTLYGAFTIEAWVYRNSSTARVILIEGRTAGGYANYLVGILPAGTIEFVTANSANFYNPSIVVPSNQWAHVALVRNINNVVTAYVNGVAASTTVTISGVLTPAAGLVWIGGQRDANSDGYFDDLRISQFARYTQNFIPPSVALPRQ